MKFSEEEATELMQYVTDRRSYEYEKLKEKVKKRSSDFYYEEQSSKISVTYKLVHEAGLQESL